MTSCRFAYIETARHADRIEIGQFHRVGATQKVRGVQQIDVQRVALYPLPAVQQSTQGLDSLVHDNAARVFHGEAGGHLIGDRADPADSRRDIWRFGEVTPHQERLEVARRFKDVERDVDDPSVLDTHAQRALSFYARDPLGADGAT